MKVFNNEQGLAELGRLVKAREKQHIRTLCCICIAMYGREIPVSITASADHGYYATAVINRSLMMKWDPEASVAFMKLANEIKKKLEGGYL